jgi:hypothetical protein
VEPLEKVEGKYVDFKVATNSILDFFVKGSVGYGVWGHDQFWTIPSPK